MLVRVVPGVVDAPLVIMGTVEVVVGVVGIEKGDIFLTEVVEGITLEEGVEVQVGKSGLLETEVL